MRSRWIAILLAGAVMAGMVPAAEPAPPKKPGYTILADLNAPSLTVWMSYLLARMGYVMKHPADYPAQGSGRMVARFPEEVAARSAAVEVYRKMRADGKNERDAYWEDVLKVSRAGFMPEYIWTYFRKPAWKEAEAPKKLGQFSTWQRGNLADHRAVTYGDIGFERAR